MTREKRLTKRQRKALERLTEAFEQLGRTPESETRYRRVVECLQTWQEIKS